jgi:hypothetical protein
MKVIEIPKICIYCRNFEISLNPPFCLCNFNGWKMEENDLEGEFRDYVRTAEDCGSFTLVT